MYYLAVNYRSDGRQLTEAKTLQEIGEMIKNNYNYGYEYKVLKDVEVNLILTDSSSDGATETKTYKVNILD